jgi:hypothetical protein
MGVLKNKIKTLVLAVALFSSCNDEKVVRLRGSTLASGSSSEKLLEVISTSLKENGVGPSEIEPIAKSFVDATQPSALRLSESSNPNSQALPLTGLVDGFRSSTSFATGTNAMKSPGIAAIIGGLSEGSLTFWLSEQGVSGVSDVKVILREMMRIIFDLKEAKPDISDDQLSRAMGKISGAVRIASFVKNNIDDTVLVLDSGIIAAEELGASLEAGRISTFAYSSSINEASGAAASGISSAEEVNSFAQRILDDVASRTQSLSSEADVLANLVIAVNNGARSVTPADDLKAALRATLSGVLEQLVKSGVSTASEVATALSRFDSDASSNGGSGSTSGSSSGSETGTTSGSSTIAGPFLPSSITVVPTYTTSSNAINQRFWNKFVDAEINGIDCDASTSTICRHAGEARKVALPGVTSCDGLSATDSLSAFVWECSIENGNAVVKSRGLASGKGLRDLVTASGWKNNSVTITSGTTTVTSTPEVWWDNTVVSMPVSAGSYTFNAYSVYVFSSSETPPSAWTFGGNGVAIVTVAGAVLTMPRIHLITRNFTWIDGDFEYVAPSGSTPTHGFFSFTGGFNTIHGSSFIVAPATNAGNYLSFNGNGNRLLDTKVELSSIPSIPVCTQGYSAGSSILSFSGNRNLASRNRFSTGCAAILIYSGIANQVLNNQVVRSHFSIFNTLIATDSVIQNNELSGSAIGIRNQAPGVVISGNFISNQAQYGIYDDDTDQFPGTLTARIVTSNNTLLNATYSGASFARTGVKFLNSLAAANGNGLSQSTGSGVSFAAVSDFLIKDSLLLADAAEVSVTGLYEDSAQRPSGIISNSKIGRCKYPSNRTACTNDTSSLIADSFKGRASSLETANAHAAVLANGSGVMALADITDWFKFSYPNQIFANWGTGFTILSAGARKKCDSTNCALWDYRIKSDATQILNTVPCPTVADALTHRFYAASGTSDDYDVSFLSRAQELLLDGIGNDNGICEQGETCLRLKNYGSYQGHGALGESSCPALTGNFSNVKLLEYSLNGY